MCFVVAECARMRTPEAKRRGHALSRCLVDVVLYIYMSWPVDWIVASRARVLADGGERELVRCRPLRSCMHICFAALLLVAAGGAGGFEVLLLIAT